MTNKDKGDAFAKMMYSGHEMNVYAVFIYQQIMSRFEFDQFNEEIVCDLVRI